MGPTVSCSPCHSLSRIASLKQFSQHVYGVTIRPLHASRRSNYVNALPSFGSQDGSLERATITHQQQRRILLAASFAAALSIAASAQAAETATRPPARPPSVFDNAFVVPALSVPQYLNKLRAARPAAWVGIQSCIDEGRYKDLSEALFLSPFDDVRQSAFYIPWALLRHSSEQEAVTAQLAYRNFLDKTKALDKTAIAAARFQAEDEEVQAAFADVSSSLDAFLENFPA